MRSGSTFTGRGRQRWRNSRLDIPVRPRRRAATRSDRNFQPARCAVAARFGGFTRYGVRNHAPGGVSLLVAIAELVSVEPCSITRSKPLAMGHHCARRSGAMSPSPASSGAKKRTSLDPGKRGQGAFGAICTPIIPGPMVTQALEGRKTVSYQLKQGAVNHPGRRPPKPRGNMWHSALI